MKKLVSIVASLALLFALVPASVHATSTNATISVNGGTPVEITGYVSGNNYTGTLVEALNNTTLVPDGADVVINIPDGVTLNAGVKPTSIADANACVGIPTRLKSLTFTGTGTLMIAGAAQPKLYFNGVTGVIDGITIKGSGGTTTCDVYGGTSPDKMHDETTLNPDCAGVLDSTNITLKSGTVGFLIGGSANTDVGTTNVTVSGGNVLMSVVGGNTMTYTQTNSFSQTAGGNITTTNVTITGGSFGASGSGQGYIYGGSDVGTVTNANVTMTGGTSHYVCAGAGGAVTNFKLNFGGTAKNTNNVAGGLIAGAGTVTNSEVNITGGLVGDSVYGGGIGANTVTTNAKVNFTGGYVTRCVHGGAYQGTVTSTVVTVDGGTFLRNGVYSYVFGGGKKDNSVTGSATVNVKKAYNCLGVSGGGLGTDDSVKTSLTTNIVSVKVNDLYIIDNSAVTPGSGVVATPLEVYTKDLSVDGDNIYVQTDIALSADLSSTTNALTHIASGKKIDLGSYSISGAANATGEGKVLKTVGSNVVTIDFNGGTTALGSILATSSTITLGVATKAGSVFKGWNDGTTTYDANTAINISGNTTLTAVWGSNKTKVTGTVTDGNNVISGATVKIQVGSDIIATTTTDASGNYSFADIPNGAYNLVVSKDINGETHKETVLILANQTTLKVNVILPTDATKNSAVVVKEGTPAVVVGGVEEVAQNQQEIQGSTILIALTVESKKDTNTTAQTEIKDEVTQNTINFIDLTLTKQVDSGTPSDIGSSNNVILTTVIPFDFTNKTDVELIRYHNGSVQILREYVNMPSNPVDGSYYLDRTTNHIYLYASDYSTYAIAYNAVASPVVGTGVVNQNLIWVGIAIVSITALAALVLFRKKEEE